MGFTFVLFSKPKSLKITGVTDWHTCCQLFFDTSSNTDAFFCLFKCFTCKHEYTKIITLQLTFIC